MSQKLVVQTGLSGRPGPIGSLLRILKKNWKIRI